MDTREEFMRCLGRTLDMSQYIRVLEDRRPSKHGGLGDKLCAKIY